MVFELWDNNPDSDCSEVTLMLFQAVMIGDDIVSDVGGAQACGIRGIQVRTGKYRFTDYFILLLHLLWFNVSSSRSEVTVIVHSCLGNLV